MVDDATRALRAASLGELAWLESGSPRAAGVVPLVDDEGPVVALTFDQSALATSLGAAAESVLTVREPRNTGPGWSPLSVRCRTRLVPDPEGEHLRGHLLLQELRRYPPSRRYADSPLLMREHWWYLPRLLVRLEVVEVLPPPQERTGPDDVSLTTAAGGRVSVCGATAGRDTHRAPTWGPAPSPGPGVLLAQDATFPDLEVWTWTAHPVRVAEDATVGGPVAAPAALRPRTLVDRWRSERAFARACRRGLREWGRDVVT